MLIKSLYGLLRDEGYIVDTTDHPAAAVQAIMKTDYEAVIMDSCSFGLSAEDAQHIIRAMSPKIRVILIGTPENGDDTSALRVPADPKMLRELLNARDKYEYLS